MSTIVRDTTFRAGRRSHAGTASPAESQEASRSPDAMSVLSHELLSPLNLIKGYATTLLELGDILDDEHKSNYVRRIDAAADRLVRLITNLRELSSLTEANEFGVGFVSVVELAQKTVSEMQSQTTKHAIKLRAPDDLPQVKVNRLKIEQVMSNLLANAIKYSPRGGDIEVEIRLVRDAWGLLRLADDSSPIRLPSITVSISDRGIGIPEAELERVFEPFYRIENHATRSISGAGLGLHICRKIVGAHGGHIWASQRAGGGTTFAFSLPMTAPSQGDDHP